MPKRMVYFLENLKTRVKTQNGSLRTTATAYAISNSDGVGVKILSVHFSVIFVLKYQLNRENKHTVGHFIGLFGKKIVYLTFNLFPPAVLFRFCFNSLIFYSIH